MKDSDNNSHFAIAYCVAMTAGLALVLLIHSEAGPKLIECVRQWETLITGIMSVAAAIWAANKAYKGIQEQIKQTNGIVRAQNLSRNEQKIAIAISAKQKLEEYIENNNNLIRIIEKFRPLEINANQFITESNANSPTFSPEIIENIAHLLSETQSYAPILNSSRKIRELNRCRYELEQFLERNIITLENHKEIENEISEKFSHIASASSAVRSSLSNSLKSIQDQIQSIETQNEIITKATK